MHRLVIGATVASLISIACASGRIRAQSHVLPRVPTKARSQCGSFRGTTREGLGAEILAGALRFGDRALLIGQPTSGDGLIQVLYDFPSPGSSSSALKLSIAEALLPGDRSFDGLGIAPDLE